MGESRIKAMPGHRLARQGNVVLLPNAGQSKAVNPVRRGRKPGCLSFAAGQRRKVAANLRQQDEAARKAESETVRQGLRRFSDEQFMFAVTAFAEGFYQIDFATAYQTVVRVAVKERAAARTHLRGVALTQGGGT